MGIRGRGSTVGLLILMVAAATSMMVHPASGQEVCIKERVPTEDSPLHLIVCNTTPGNESVSVSVLDDGGSTFVGVSVSNYIDDQTGEQETLVCVTFPVRGQQQTVCEDTEPLQ